MCCSFSLCGNSKVVHAEIFQWIFIYEVGFVALKPYCCILYWDQQNGEYLRKAAGETLSLFEPNHYNNSHFFFLVVVYIHLWSRLSRTVQYLPVHCLLEVHLPIPPLAMLAVVRISWSPSVRFIKLGCPLLLLPSLERALTHSLTQDCDKETFQTSGCVMLACGKHS